MKIEVVKAKEDDRRSLADRLYAIEIEKEELYKRYIAAFDKLEKEAGVLEVKLRELRQ